MDRAVVAVVEAGGRVEERRRRDGEGGVVGIAVRDLLVVSPARLVAVAERALAADVSVARASPSVT